MNAIRGYLLGRCRRLEYWITILVLVGCHVGLKRLPGNAALSWLLIGAWFLLASRRFRDIGWPVWLSLTPIPILFALLAAAYFVGVDMDNKAQIAILNILPFGIVVVWLGFWATIGVWKSKPSSTPTPQAQAEVFG